jgi:hypothetical protein
MILGYFAGVKGVLPLVGKFSVHTSEQVPTARVVDRMKRSEHRKAILGYI